MQDFRTPDLLLSSALLHERCNLLGLDRTDPQRCEFVFEDSGRLRDIVEQYWRNELLCPARSLLAASKEAKHILYDFHT